jgi:hypothetical protein
MIGLNISEKNSDVSEYLMTAGYKYCILIFAFCTEEFRFKHNNEFDNSEHRR